MMQRDQVCIVEDDSAVRHSLELLISTLGFQVCSHSSGEDFLAAACRQTCDCVVLDLRLPGMDGLEVQRHLEAQELSAAAVFITGHGDIPVAVEAMRNGAVDFLQKPFDNQVFLERVRQAIARGKERRAHVARQQQATQRLATLTGREQEVLTLLIKGHMNKSIAAELGISTKTVEDHRANLMRKMEVRSVAELVLLATEGSIEP